MRSEIEMLESNLEADLRSQCAAVERDYRAALETTRGELEHLQTSFEGGDVRGRNKAEALSDGQDSSSKLGPGPGQRSSPVPQIPGREDGLVGFAVGDEEGWQKTCWRAEAVSEAADCTLDKLLGIKAYSVQLDAPRIQQALSLLKQLGATLKECLSLLSYLMS